MTRDEAKIIKDFGKCDFKEIHQYFKERSEAKKQATKEEKKKLKEENEAIAEEYGWALMDGHKEKIGNFKTEPPGLFRGRGDHPKQGKIKRRIQPEDVTINIGKKATVPSPPEGHKWKSVQHDNKVHHMCIITCIITCMCNIGNMVSLLDREYSRTNKICNVKSNVTS